LDAAIDVVDQAITRHGTPVMQRLLEASRTKPALALEETRQPTMQRAQALMTKAV
jgi:hypothetical protein